MLLIKILLAWFALSCLFAWGWARFQKGINPRGE